MRKTLIACVACLSMAGSFAQAGLFGLRIRPVGRTEVENRDPSADVLRVTQAYGTRVAAEPQPTSADLPQMPTLAPMGSPLPAPVYAPPAAAPENVAAATVPVAVTFATFAILPLMKALPWTASFAAGEVVPRPTLPPVSIRLVSTPLL